MRGLIVGVLVLAGLEAVVSSADAANRAGGLLVTIGGLVDRFLDPTVAAIPDRSTTTTATAAAAPSSTGPAGPPRHASAPTGPGRAPVVAPAPAAGGAFSGGSSW